MNRNKAVALICKAQFVGLGILILYYVLFAAGFALLLGVGGSERQGSGFYALIADGAFGLVCKPLVFVLGVAGLVCLYRMRPEVEAGHQPKTIAVLAVINVLATAPTVRLLASYLWPFHSVS